MITPVNFEIIDRSGNFSKLCISSNSNINVYENLFLYIESLSHIIKDNFIVVGDFNNPGLDRYYTDMTTDKYVIELNNFLSYYNCEKPNKIRNVYGHILDIVYLYILPKDSYHPTLEIYFAIENARNLELKRQSVKYNFKKAYYYLLCNMFSKVNWSMLVEFDNVDEAVNKFYNKINQVFEICVPKSTT